MRFFLVTALAAFVFASSCDAAVAGAPNGLQIDDNTSAGFSRGLRSTQTDLEERANVGFLDSEDRAVANVAIKYQSLYMAKITPKQAKLILGISDNMVELTKTTRSLQRFYTGYYSYYTAMEKRKRRKKELKNQVKM